MCGGVGLGPAGRGGERPHARTWGGQPGTDPGGRSWALPAPGTCGCSGCQLLAPGGPEQGPPCTPTGGTLQGCPCPAGTRRLLPAAWSSGMWRLPCLLPASPTPAPAPSPFNTPAWPPAKPHIPADCNQTGLACQLPAPLRPWGRGRGEGPWRGELWAGSCPRRG